MIEIVSNEFVKSVYRLELDRDIKVVNDAFRRLETKGRQDESNAYRALEKLADRNPYLVRKNKKGNYRLRGIKDIENSGKWEEMRTEVNKFMNSKTLTVTGIDNRYRNSYEAFKKQYNMPDLTFTRYIQFFNKTTLNSNFIQEFASEQYQDLIKLDPKELEQIASDFDNTSSNTEKNKLIAEAMRKAQSIPTNNSFIGKIKRSLGRTKVKTQSTVSGFFSKLKNIFKRK